MACCSKVVKRKKKTIVPDYGVVSLSIYKECSDGTLKLKYLEKEQSRFKGCKTGHVYLFANNVETVIDVNDGKCLLDKYPDRFCEVVEFSVQSNNSESKSKPKDNKSRDSEGDGQVHETSECGVPGNSTDMES